MSSMPLSPMLLTTADQPPQGDEWIHQLKYDGLRCLLQVVDGRLRLWTRHGIECSAQFPELQSIKFDRSVILDGELVVFDGEQTNFEAVTQRMLTKRKTVIDTLMDTSPAHFIAFDILQYGEKSTMRRPLHRRQSALDEIVPDHPSIRCCESFDIGGALFDSTRQRGLEGVVSKRRQSLYVPGVRSRNWRKSKHYQQEIMSIVGIRQSEYELLVARDNAPPCVVQFVPAQVRHDIRLRINIADTTDTWVYLNPPIPVEVRYASTTRGGWLRDASVVRVVE